MPDIIHKTKREGGRTKAPRARIDYCPRCGGDGCPACEDQGGFVLTIIEREDD